MAQSRGWQSDWQRQQAAFAREEERQRKRDEAETRRLAREQAQAQATAGSAEAERRTKLLEQRVDELNTFLVRGLASSRVVDLNERRQSPMIHAPNLRGLDQPLAPPQWSDFAPVPPGALSRVFGGNSRYQLLLTQAEEEFTAAQQAHQEQEVDRQAHVRSIRAEHQREVHQALAAADAANRELDAWIAGIASRKRESLERYFLDVLERCPLPEGFPQRADITVDVEDQHLVAQVELPGRSIVPNVRSVSYTRSRNELVPRARPEKESAGLYRAVISQMTLLVIHDLFASDPRIVKVSFNGHVSATDRATGRPAYPCLISLIVDRSEWEELVLTEVTPDQCLRHLRALVSAHPFAVEPIRPLVDFDRSRYAFVQGIDIVADLDHREDLMTLSPTEFEHLVRQVFEAAPGMQGWTTQPSKDDGVDAVIFNDTPLTGGLTVVQAKQYTQVVGVAHVRELLGAMEDKKAGRGVLVTTSRFTKGSYELAERLGRIQLIDGPGFAYMIKDLIGKDVIIGRRQKKS